MDFKKSNNLNDLNDKSAASADNVKKLHNVTVENRNKAVLSGVNKVIESSDKEVLVETACGRLYITGENLKISRFDESSGVFAFEGKINSLVYREAKPPLLKRMFK